MKQTAQREVTPPIGIRNGRNRNKEGTGLSGPRNAKQQQDKKSGKVVLPLFRESGKEGALKYDDWRAEVDEYLRKGHSNEQVKSAMFSSLEGQPRKNFQDCDEDGDLTPAEILVKLDGVYNASVAFRDLSARLCALKQGMHENVKTYYERMVDIAGKLREHHAERFRPGELKSMKKECFFAGLPGQQQVSCGAHERPGPYRPG